VYTSNKERGNKMINDWLIPNKTEKDLQAEKDWLEDQRDIAYNEFVKAQDILDNIDDKLRDNKHEFFKLKLHKKIFGGK
jgi:hypothetical protein